LRLPLSKLSLGFVCVVVVVAKNGEPKGGQGFLAREKTSPTHTRADKKTTNEKIKNKKFGGNRDAQQQQPLAPFHIRTARRGTPPTAAHTVSHHYYYYYYYAIITSCEKIRVFSLIRFQIRISTRLSADVLRHSLGRFFFNFFIVQCFVWLPIEMKYTTRKVLLLQLMPLERTNSLGFSDCRSSRTLEQQLSCCCWPRLCIALGFSKRALVSLSFADIDTNPRFGWASECSLIPQ
jgi:hypothetical protein